MMIDGNLIKERKFSIGGLLLQEKYGTMKRENAKVVRKTVQSESIKILCGWIYMDLFLGLFGIVIGIIVIYFVGDSLYVSFYSWKREREYRKAEENYRKQEEAKKSNHDDEVNSLVCTYINSSFTKICAKRLLNNFNENIEYCQKHRNNIWWCRVTSRSIELVNDSSIDFMNEGYNNLNGIQIEAFAKAIVRNLPHGFSLYTDYDNEYGDTIAIQRIIETPHLKDISDM